MPPSQELKALVSQIPDPDKNGTYVNLDEAKIAAIDKTVAELRKGGPAAVAGLIDLLVDPAAGDDTKPHYTLYLWAVRASAPGEDQARAEFASAVAAQLAADRPKAVRRYLIEQLQVAGGKEVAEALGKALPEADLCDTAARALAAIGGEAAAGQLLAALPKVQGRSRLSVLKKLALLRVPAAGEAFQAALADGDADVRIAAAWGIARLAAASAAQAMLQAADAHEGWERINITDACMALAEALQAAGKKDAAAGIWRHMVQRRSEPSTLHIRQAAERALAAAK